MIPLLFACAPAEGPHSIDQVLENALSMKDAAPLRRLGYTIQVGAFLRQENAVRLEKRLRATGVDAYSFLHESGLYKVRFGDHDNRGAARRQALFLQKSGQIDDFFIIAASDHAAARFDRTDNSELRDELVSTVRRFLGVPYRWGGESADSGFDCSGLTMVVYRLNGLDLPRNSAWQFEHGRAVDKADLRSGDLVFFATNGGRRVSHVGMYIGRDRFIHAPRPGRDVCVSRLSNSYFRKRFVGGRTYL